MADYPRTLDFAAALAALNAVVAEAGADHVYVSTTSVESDAACLNVLEDENGNLCPGCIVGAALHHLGVPLDELAECNAAAAQHTLCHLGIAADQRTICLLRDAQIEQDHGVPWGDAVRWAVRSAARQ